MISSLIIISGPVRCMDRAGFCIAVFSSALNFGYLGLLILRTIHFMMIFGSVIIRIIRIGPSVSLEENMQGTFADRGMDREKLFEKTGRKIESTGNPSKYKESRCFLTSFNTAGNRT